MDWRHDTSHGAIEKEISGTWASVCSPPDADWVGFIPGDEALHVASSCGSGCATRRGDVGSGVQIVFFFLDFCNDVRSSCQFVFFVLALAGNPTPTQSTVAVRNMKLFGGLLGQLEDRGREDTWVAGFVRNLMWPASSFVREMLVMLHELDFQSMQRGAGHSGPVCVVIRVHEH